MAYPISSTLKNSFLSLARQTVTCVFDFTDSDEPLTITGANIPLGGLSINRYATSSNTLEIGSVVAAELSLKLDNSRGNFNSYNFEGARIRVTLGTEKSTETMPLGRFTVDNSPKRGREILISALDAMVFFDKPVVEGTIEYPITVANMVSRLCTICNVTLNTNVDNLPNGNYVITSAPTGKDLTYRQLLGWCAAITGTCAYIDWNNELRLEWYSTVSDEVLTISNRFSSTLADSPITITGVSITEDKTVYLAGEEGYVIDISGNSLIQHDEAEILLNLSPVLVGFSYVPYTAVTMPMPYLYPLDIIVFEDERGNTYSAPITDVTFQLNKNMAFAAKGETTEEKGWAASNPMTSGQRVIIEQIQKEQNETLNTRVQSVLAFNELITNSMGLYSTNVQQSDGSVKLYLHDRPTLEESNTIFTATTNGIAWTTDGWNEGSPVWSYGVTAAGDALFRMLSAEGLTISRVGNDYHIEVTPSTFTIYYRDMLVTTINADTMDIPRVSVEDYINFGDVRIVKSPTGIDIIFAD